MAKPYIRTNMHPRLQLQKHELNSAHAGSAYFTVALSNNCIILPPHLNVYVLCRRCFMARPMRLPPVKHRVQ
jgi:hypothetical protein